MKTLYYATVLSLVCLFAGCKSASRNEELPVLNVEVAIDNPQKFDLSEIAEKIEFIPLDDSSKESLIGSGIGRLQESERGFYICEGFMTPVQYFDRTGKFVSLIGRIGRGPGETSYVMDMAVDYGTGNVYINGGGNNVVAYDPTGRMLARNDFIASFYSFSYYNDQLITLKFASVRGYDYDVEKVTLLEIYSHDLQSEGSLAALNVGPYDYVHTDGRSGAFGTGSAPFMSDNGKSLIVRQGRNDTIYYYNAGVLNPAYMLNIGHYDLPAEGYGLDPLVEMDDKFYSVINLWEGDRYIVVSADNYQRTPSGQRIPRRRLIFDKSDLSASGFSATGGKDNTFGIFLDDLAFTPCYIRDNRLVGYIQAFDIVNNAETLTDPDLKEIAVTLKEDGNPVLVIAELK